MTIKDEDYAEAQRLYMGPRMHVGTVVDREISAFMRGADWARTEEWEYGVGWHYQDIIAAWVVEDEEEARSGANKVTEGDDDTDYIPVRRRPARFASPWEQV